MPMLRILVPLTAGIACAAYYTLPVWLLIGLLLLTVAATHFTRQSIWPFLLLFTAGFLYRSNCEAVNSIPLNRPISLLLKIDTDCVAHKQGNTGEATIEAWRDQQGPWYRTKSRVLLRTDSVTSLCGGEQVLFHGRIYPLRGGSASYRRLMQRRGYMGRCYLTSPRTISLENKAHASLRQRAVRHLRHLTSECSDPMAAAVVQAMTLADRNNLSTSLREAYARSGMSHLLAVSGLHTGIVFLLINLALAWMIFLHHGIVLRNLTAMLCLWLYVAAAGFPPSAVRAAVMCSLLQWSLSTLSTHNALNNCAAAATLMLVWNPRWLGDISFQLSFIAVAALIAWGIPLGRKIPINQPLLRYLVQGFLVALVASLATAPLVSHTFGIVSWVGILTSPFVVLLAMVIVGAGLLLTLLSPLQPILLPLAEWAAALQNRIATLTASWEGGHFAYTLSSEATIFIYLFFGVATLYGWSLKRKKALSLSYDEPR